MAKIAAKLKRKICEQAQNRCGYCLLPQSLNPSPLEIEHILPTAAGGSDAEKIFGSRVGFAMVTKASKPERPTPKPVKLFCFLIPERKTGTDISAGLLKE